MKTLVGFDCATQNMGVCYVRFDDQWREKANVFSAQLYALYDKIKHIDTGEFIEQAVTLVRAINTFLDRIITITFFNVFDLIPGKQTAHTSIVQRTGRLKRLLHELDSQNGIADIILIEYQMKQNDISRAISHQILYHYIAADSCEVQYASKKVTHCITYAIKKHAVEHGTPCPDVRTPVVDVVGASLKNAYHVCDSGAYANFISRYSNYRANKKHSTYNFMEFARVFEYDTSELGKKTDDIADSFMMIYGWLKKHEML